MRALIEAVGSPIWGPLLPTLREAAEFIVGTDVDPLAWGLYRLDQGALVPSYGRPEVWDQLLSLCARWRIDTVFPSLNEGLSGWAQRKAELGRMGISVVISDPETIRLFTDKWETFQFFRDHGIPTPRTSLAQDYPLLKPRNGRGGTGIRLLGPGETVAMDAMVTQELLSGQEYSIDALCDPAGRPLCVVIRERLQVESGLSVRGRVVADPELEAMVRRILAAVPVWGPVNLQCFRTRSGIQFTEVNPRLAGGLSLSMAATGNWFQWIATMLRGGDPGPQAVRSGLVMLRTFQDVIVPEQDLLGRAP
jgi:carbamoyl-phosphate synthase large subunit